MSGDTGIGATVACIRLAEKVLDTGGEAGDKKGVVYRTEGEERGSTYFCREASGGIAWVAVVVAAHLEYSVPIPASRYVHSLRIAHNFVAWFPPHLTLLRSLKFSPLPACTGRSFADGSVHLLHTRPTYVLRGTYSYNHTHLLQNECVSFLRALSLAVR